MDPSGDYSVHEVTIEVDGKAVTKGVGATGRFVSIGRDGTHYTRTMGADGSITRNTINDPTRQVIVTLQKESPSNAIFFAVRGEFGASLRIRRSDGSALFDGNAWIGTDRRDVNATMCEWQLTATG
jgi:hypothetical protein